MRRPLIRLRHLLPEYREKAVYKALCSEEVDEYGPLPVLGMGIYTNLPGIVER
jgi:hypothetical protein